MGDLTKENTIKVAELIHQYQKIERFYNTLKEIDEFLGKDNEHGKDIFFLQNTLNHKYSALISKVD